MPNDSAMVQATYRVRRFALLFLVCAAVQPILAAEDPPEPKVPAPEQAPSVDDKTMAEVIKAEEQLAAIIQKHDASGLDSDDWVGQPLLSSNPNEVGYTSCRGADAGPPAAGTVAARIESS